MSGPKRNPDKINAIGIVVVGICGAVLTYVSIVALQAFYMDDTSDIQMMADYGGQDTSFKSIRTQQLENVKAYAPKAAPPAPKEGQPAAPQTYTIAIDDAIRLVVESAKKDPSNLVPAIGPAVTPSVLPIFGRPKLIVAPAPAPAPDAGSAAAPADGAGAGSSAPMTPTGGQGPGGGPPPAAAPAQPKATPTPAPAQPKATPAPAPAQPKAAPVPAQPKAAPAPAQPKAAPAPAQPKATAPKGGATPPPQPKKGNAA